MTADTKPWTKDEIRWRKRPNQNIWDGRTQGTGRRRTTIYRVIKTTSGQIQLWRYGSLLGSRYESVERAKQHAEDWGV
jgi:hypothetical protein